MNDNKLIINRRKFLQSSALAAGAFAVAPLQTACTPANKTAESRSNFGGVEIGAITYSFRLMPTTDAGNILLYTLSAGLGTLEMMGEVAENYAGRPKAPQFGPQIRPEPGQVLTPEQQRQREAQQEARRVYNEEVRAWRLSVPMSKYEELAGIYKMAGVNIHIIKLSPNSNTSDDELDYMFNVCKALGAMGVSTELDLETARRVSPFAVKHGKFLLLHNHAQFADESFTFDPFLEFENVRINFDMGIYYGSTGKDPRDIVEKYHEKIASIHIKDYTAPTATLVGMTEQNRVWGQGDTPLKEFLLYIQSNAGKPGWPVHCDIEMSYVIPEGSDSVIEVARCADFVKKILIK
ncbi:MAG: twin-arginine translocation signal domain-containing protein [Tannerella sp.]|jgi:sugar phosphate isomerase/epimerase|nr:twin-arginine translocation signal domain-containing protein [Tannerella sp.]